MDILKMPNNNNNEKPTINTPANTTSNRPNTIPVIKAKPTVDKQFIINELLDNLSVLDESINSGEYDREVKYFLSEKRETLITLYKLIDNTNGGGDNIATLKVEIEVIE